MPLNIEAARDQVLDHLDDPRGVRFAKTTSGVQDWSRVYRGLRSAQSSCLDKYLAAGGNRFWESVDVDSTGGTAQLAAFDPAALHAVQIIPDTDSAAKWPIDEGDPLTLGLPDLTDRSLSVIITRYFRIPDPVDPGDLLMGTVAGAARSWDAFDEWVCAVAAQQVGVKDNERREGLAILAKEKEDDVLKHIKTPSSSPWPARRGQSWSLRRLRWVWMPQPRTLQLVYDATSSWWRY